MNKSNFTCIKCADKERFKTRPKRVYHTDFRLHLHYLLDILVSDISDVKVMSSTVAVIGNTYHLTASTYSMQISSFSNQLSYTLHDSSISRVACQALVAEGSDIVGCRFLAVALLHNNLGKVFTPLCLAHRNYGHIALQKCMQLTSNLF